MSDTLDSDRVRIFDTTLRDGEQSPGASMNLDEKIRIAEILDITRERVRQILKDAGLPTYIPRHYGFCKLCGQDIPATRTTYCSAKCRTKASQITISCTFCGNSKTLRRSAYNAQVKRGYKYMYCSVECRQRGNWAFRNK